MRLAILVMALVLGWSATAIAKPKKKVKHPVATNESATNSAVAPLLIYDPAEPSKLPTVVVEGAAPVIDSPLYHVTFNKTKNSDNTASETVTVTESTIILDKP